MPKIATGIKCVTTDYVENNLDWEKKEYARLGVTFEHHQLRLASPREIIEIAEDADILIVDQARISSAVIRGLKKCRLIIRHGDGYDNLDLKAATESGILCINQPGFWSREVAEQAFALGISLALKIPSQQSVAKTPRTGTDAGWDLHRVMPYRSLKNLTVGIVGYGKIGTITSELYRPVVGNVLVHDPYITQESVADSGIDMVGLTDLISSSDIISLHIPANEETTSLFDSELIGKIKQNSILVNTARGSIVDIEAVTSAITDGRLGGAALDTTVPEPLDAHHPLFDFPNVIVTPHMAWYSEDALWEIRKNIVAVVLGFSQGELPGNILNPEVLDSKELRSAQLLS